MAQPTDDNLARLVDQHLPEMLRFATRLTGNVTEAEDLVQDSLMRVLQTRSTFRGDAAFRTWLFRIVVNAFRDAIRTRRPLQPLPENVRHQRQRDPGQAAEAEELRCLIAESVSTLPPRQREVLVLIVYEQFNAQQVADLSGMSTTNVYATLHHARKQLQTKLATHLEASR